jgi:hypothetical protein
MSTNKAALTKLEKTMVKIISESANLRGQLETMGLDEEHKKQLNSTLNDQHKLNLNAIKQSGGSAVTFKFAALPENDSQGENTE